MRLMRLFTAATALTVITYAGEPASAQTACTSNPANPILQPGPPGTWDDDLTFFPRVVFKDGVYYMFYSAQQRNVSCSLAIGLATSTDPLSGWQRACESQPILEPGGAWFDACLVSSAAPLIVDDTWIVYYNGRQNPAGFGPGPYIGRATATNPCGPWERLPDPVLQTGSPGEWDDGTVWPDTVLIDEHGVYRMYYTGNPSSGITHVGMATSPDGITWTKYDDPTTTDPPYAESDPVLHPGDPGEWDAGLVSTASVHRTDCRWDMYYTGREWPNGPGHIGYASSDDGLNWMKHAGNPIMAPGEPWAFNQVVSGSALAIGSTYYFYYMGNTLPTLPFGASIGVASAPMEPDVNGNGIPDLCECLADINGDNTVDVLDLLELLSAWGPCPGCPADVNFDGTVDVLDLLEVLAAWGACP